MTDRPVESWRLRAAVSEALDAFNSSYMHDMWAKALARRATEPEAAVTSARTLLETVCKHILDAARCEFREGAPLPQLYAQTAKVLDMAPSQQLAPLFNKIFTACADVIDGIGRLRNELSDSHGRGPFGDMPDWRHAELAVNLSGAMATYLAAVWKARQPTVADVIRAYIDRRKEELGRNAVYSLERILRSDFGDLVATKLRPGDVVIYFEERAAADRTKPSTARRELSLLRTALGGHSAAAVDAGAEILKQRNLVSGKYVAAAQRVAQDHSQTLVDYLAAQSEVVRDRKHPGLSAGMADVVQFAVWSGRRLAEILELEWAHIDWKKKSCKVPGKESSFLLFDRAWEVIDERRSRRLKPEGRIFPYDRAAVSIRHTNAVRTLVEQGKIPHKIRFHDYRHEAAHRLLERGHSVQDVARATGLAPGRIMKIADEVQAHRTAARPPEPALA
jgi:integrase